MESETRLTYSKVHAPLLIKLLNKIASGFTSNFEHFARLDAQDLMQVAGRSVGLDDRGDLRVKAALTALVDSVNWHENKPTPTKLLMFDIPT